MPPHPATTEILRFFSFDHLPPGDLRETSQQCAVLAGYMVDQLGDRGGAELTAGLRKLLEAKDCFVRAALPRRE